MTSSEHNRVCSFILDDTPMESLKTVLKSQGLELAGEGYRGERRQKYEYAVFCRANSSEKNISYEIDAERGPIRGWPADTAAKLTFRRFDGYPPLGPTAAYGVEGSCPIRVIIYDFFSRSPPTPPNIEPWGEKEPEAPPALEEPRH
ncbi:MAG TPA: hypothetical protein VNH64_07060 [Parvularculaceae bacterium]|nr:hypothetical protein [Parvularculaceae bacterium]